MFSKASSLHPIAAEWAPFYAKVPRGMRARSSRGFSWSIPPSFYAYGATSAVTTGVEFAVLHTALTLHAYWPFAVSLGFLTASLFQFCVLRYIVFRVAHKPVLFQVNAYIVAVIISWWLVVYAVSLLKAVLPLTTLEARAISLPLLFPVNYLINRRFIFRN